MLPYQTRVFNSVLSVAQARARFQDAVGPVAPAGAGRPGRSFDGVARVTPSGSSRSWRCSWPYGWESRGG
jgi:hypothetical protein